MTRRKQYRHMTRADCKARVMREVINGGGVYN